MIILDEPNVAYPVEAARNHLDPWDYLHHPLAVGMAWTDPFRGGTTRCQDRFGYHVSERTPALDPQRVFESLPTASKS